MSRLIDELNRVAQSVSPMGFKTKEAGRAGPKLLLIAGLVEAEIDSATEHLAGADAGLLYIDKGKSVARAMDKARQIAPDIPWGVRLKGFNPDEMAEIMAAGCDYIMFSADSPAVGPVKGDETGCILEVEATLSEGPLPAVARLPLDAVLISPEEGILTWRRLIYLQRCADLITQPLLVSVQADVTESELKAIGMAGAGGVVVALSAGQARDRLDALRRVIDGLDLSPPRRGGKPGALLPRTDTPGDVAVEEIEEE